MASQQQLLILPCCHCILSGLIVILLFTWSSAYFFEFGIPSKLLETFTVWTPSLPISIFRVKSFLKPPASTASVYISYDRCHVDWAVWQKEALGLSMDKIASGRRAYREKIIWKAGLKTVHFHGRKSTVVAKSRVRFKFLPSLAVPCLFVRHLCREARNNKFAKPRNCCLLNVGRVKRHEL